jgi:uncharacterized membrane protein
MLTLPGWVATGGPDAARATLVAIAAAVITVAGVVFALTIVVLQMASQTFGPRMLRNFIRDTGTQVTLGSFASTFLYSMLALGAVRSSPARDFTPHLSVTMALILTVVSVGVIIYFIHHVAIQIQMPTVVSNIARDFRRTLAEMQQESKRLEVRLAHCGAEPMLAREMEGAPVFIENRGYLQAIDHAKLVPIVARSHAHIRLLHRPGHFLARGQPIALVSPMAAASGVAGAIADAHIVGPTRTLTQDPNFAIDQLVEIAIRALSPAVNDTFTSLNCIDWLGDCLCEAAAEPLPDGVYRDEAGIVRVVEPVLTLERFIKGATDKIREAGRDLPAVYVRQLENLAKVMAVVRTADQQKVVLRHAAMILQAGEDTLREASDREDVRRAYQAASASAPLTQVMSEGA